MGIRFALWLKLSGTPAERSPEALARAHLDFQKKYGSDIQKFSTCHETFTKIFSNDGRDKSLKALQSDRRRKAKAREFYLKSLGIIAENSKVPVFATVFSPCTVVRTALGDASFFRLLKEDPGSVVDTAQGLSERIAPIMDILSSQNIGIYFANRIDRIEDYSPFIRIDRKLLSGRAGIYHLHAYSPSAKKIINSSSLKFISWESREITVEDIGEKTPVGGIDRDLLANGKFSAIENEMKDLLKKKKDAIIAPNCAIHPDITPTDNIAKVTSMARHIVGKPITKKLGVLRAVPSMQRE